MLTILLADDDILTLNQLNMYLKPLKDIAIIGQVTDGADAFPYLSSENPPQILILDMEMPKVSGLEVLQKIKNQNYSTIVLVLSNYDNFEYVKPALHLGAWDYILKHELTKQVLEEKIKEISMHLEQKQLLQKHNELTLTLSKQQFINNLALNRVIPPDSLSYMLSTPDFQGNQHLLIVLQITNYMTIYQNYHNNKYQMIDVILNFLSTMLNSLGNGIVSHTVTGEYIIYLNVAKERSSAKLHEISSLYIQTIVNGLTRYFNIHTLYEYIFFYDSIKNLRTYYLNLHHKLCYGTIASVSNEESQSKYLISIYQEKELIEAIIHFNTADAQKLIHQLFEPLHKENITLYQIKHLVNRLFDIINRLHQSFPEYEPPSLKEKIPDLMDIEQLEQYFSLYYTKYISKINSSTTQDYPFLVQEAIQYIKKNYSQDISLLSTASYCGISDVYLSKIFKYHTGISFTKYLNNYRIQLATYYLSKSNEPIKEISIKCGFFNYNYFLTVFKNITGITPTQYRNKKRENLTEQ